MRFLCSMAAFAALVVFAPAEAYGQFSLTNYSLVSETRVSRTVSDFEYRATLVNTGTARTAVNATLVSAVGTTSVVRGILHFSNVPANGQSISTDTFIIRVDRSAAFSLANLLWTYSSVSAPIANAGPPQTKAVTTTATLNGSGSSNPSGIGSLTYSWAFFSRPATSSAVLVNPTSVSPTFVVDAAGTYVIALTVSNGAGTDTAFVTISTSNSAPVANAGPSQSVALNATVTLNGSLSSDVDGNPITFLWTLSSRPSGSNAALNSTTAMNPTFVADRPGSYVAQLVVNDGTVSSNVASVTISTLNTPPVANAGPAQGVNPGATVQLTGAASTDVDGNPLTYRWSLSSVPSGSSATLSSTTIVNPTFVADRQGTYVAQLIVNDGTVDSAASTVTITTNSVPAPTANAGPGQTVQHGALVQLSGSGTDPQSRPLTYLWSLTTRPSGSTAALSSTTIANPTFTADRPGNYVAQLIVNNGFVDSAPSTVTITTTNSTPVANAGPAQTVALNSLVTLTGAASADADSDPLTYAWTFSSKPVGSTATLTGPTSVAPTFTPDLAGSYVVQLIVSDPFTSSTPVTVTITTAAPGQIILPATTNVNLGGTASFPVSLSTAAPSPSGVTVTLTINTPGSSTLSTLSVVIPAGATVPTTQPTLTGANLGTTTIGATASGYTAGSGTVNVNATMSFSAPTVSIIGTATQNLTLTLSAPAPSGGVVINLSSGTPAAATVPATVTVLQGNTAVTVPITGVAPGTSIITASRGNITSVTATATVLAPLAITTVSLPNGSQGVAYSQQLTSSGGTGAKTWTVTSGTLPTGITLSTSGLLAGTTNSLVSNLALTIQVVDSSSPVQTATANLTLTIAAVTPTTLAVTTGSGQSAVINAAFAAPLVATVTGAGGVPAAGVTVTFTAPGSGASGTFAGNVNTAVTNASGVATSAVFTANSTAGGPYNVVASVPSVTSVNFVLTNTAAAPASITVTGGSGQSATVGTAFATVLSATVRDSGNNPVSGVTVTFGVPGSGASATIAGGLTAVTNASGVATTGVVTANTTAGSYNISASVPSITGVNFAMTNTAGPAASISVTSGSGQTATIGTAFASVLTATVLDANNNPVSGATVTFGVPGSGASATIAGGLTAVTNASGVATSGVVTANTTAGAYNISASVPSVTAVNFAMTNTAGAAASISVTGGSGQSAAINTAFATALTATVRDASNNPVSGATVTFAVPGSGASATIAGGLTAVTNASGVATSGVVTANGTAGSYNISASVPSVTAVNFAMTNTAGAAASISVTGGSGQSAAINTAFGTVLTATVRDASSNPVSGATVTFGVPGSGASATIAGGLTAVTNASGVATSGVVTANSVTGSYNISASVPSVAAVNFAMTNTAGAPASITVTGGSGQSTTVSTAFASPFTVTVKDAGNNVVPNVNVTFTAPGSGASGTFAGGVTAVTLAANGSGVATSTIFSANGTAGSYNVVASAGSATANIALTNNAAPVGPTLYVTSVSVGKNLQAQITVTASQAAPAGGLHFNLTSSNVALVSVAGRPGDTGTTQVTDVVIPEGLTTISGLYVQGNADTGTTTVIASANGWTNGVGTITLTPSAFMLTGPGGTGVSTFSAPVGTTTTLAVTSVRLTPALAFAEIQQVRGGGSFSVPLSSSVTSVGTVPSSVTVSSPGGSAGSSSTNASFTAVGLGTTNLSAGVPSGFATPTGGINTIAATVTASGLIANPVSVGRNLETLTQLLVNSAPASNTIVTVTSSDPAKLLFSATASGAGVASIDLTIQAGRTVTQEFYVYGLTNTGTATFTATANGYSSAIGTVTFGNAGFVINGPVGIGANFNLTSGNTQALQVYSMLLDSNGNYIANQNVRGGVTASVTVTSSNTSVGTITTSPVNFAGGVGLVDTGFTSIGGGTSTVSVSTASAGFIAPATGTSMVVTVNAPGIGVTGDSTPVIVGKDLQTQGSFSLGAGAPAGLVVTITSNNPAALLLSKTVNGAGSASITITMSAGGFNGSYFIQALSSTGSATFTASAAGFTPRTGTINFANSGMIITGPFGEINPNQMFTSFMGRTVTLSTWYLEAGTNARIDSQAVRGGITLTPTIAVSNPALGVSFPAISFLGGTSSVESTFTNTAQGTANLTVNQPPGMINPASIFNTLALTINN